MRIAVISDTYGPQVNGVARTLVRTVDAMRQRGHEVLVLTTSDPAAAADATVHRFASKPFRLYPQLQLSLPGARAVGELLDGFRPDIVHVATPFGVGLAGRAAARRANIPLVSSYHTSFSQYARYYGLGVLAGPGWWFLRWFHNGTELTLCPTRAISDELVEHGFKNLGLWTRGVDTRQFNPSWRSPATREAWGANERTTVISYVGRLAAEKGLDVALPAMRAIAAERNDVVFVMAGDGPYAAHCRANAPANTVFTGQIVGRALSEVYASSDIFLFPSTTDTFGNVALEAMASGLVVVGADVPQTREVVPPDCGVVSRAGDASALTDALRSLLASPEEFAARRRRSVSVAAERSWEAVFDRLEADYHYVAKRSDRCSSSPTAARSDKSSSPPATAAYVGSTSSPPIERR
ncbi:MAG TPA: glycosyltransferase family 1 protein [Gemmatimonadaceae bacterium]